ncbi:RHS repeat domain-containing protein [Dyella sp. 2RAB6]|uniref:RHS repeat domain-containing protein n=1 Tax=Dyella sp. 2RAB6 TaxID=3232992 RepID=UPI003F936073
MTDATSPALNLHFARDAMGRITALGNAPGANPAMETYGYDWLSRLAGVNNAAGTSVESYTYDAIGNRTSKTGSGLATGTYSYYQYPHNWLTYIGSAARAYDNNGNTTASSVGGESFGFGYNGRNRMTIAQRNGSTVGTYTYNALGERIAKVTTLPTSLSQRFAYDENSKLIGEYGSATRDYIWLEDLPLAAIDTQGTLSTTNYVHADGLNTPRAVTNSTGATVWQWPYQSNPFGETQPTSTSGYTFNLRFAGQYYDAESRIAYNVNRHFEAATGRYLQSDPIGLAGGLSTYAYVSSSPLFGTDPMGLQEYGAPPPNNGASKPPRMGVGCVIGVGVVVAGAAIVCAPSGPGEAVCLPAAGVFAAGALGCAGGAAVANATDDSQDKDNVIPFPKPISKSFPGTGPILDFV